MAYRTLNELTIRDNFMFTSVMLDEKICRGLLERILPFPIGKVVIEKEKSMVYSPEYHGIRLDVFARDENNTRYNVEMQALSRPGISRRSRYYHSQIDMDMLLAGTDYNELPDSYVIFICDFDPFGLERYVYSFENTCQEDKNLKLEDGNRTIFLSTKGRNDGDVSHGLKQFLKFVKADLSESDGDFGDGYVADLQKAIKGIKESREMEKRFMLLEEMLKDEYREGKAEGRAEGKAEGRAEGKAEGKAETLLMILHDKWTVPESAAARIRDETDSDILDKWIRLAISSRDLDTFIAGLS